MIWYYTIYTHTILTQYGHNKHYHYITNNRSFVGSSSQLQAEDPKWEPADGMKWEEKDWEGALSKLQQEAEKSMDSKIAELTANIEKVGK